LKGPALSEPFAFLKCRFLGQLVRLVVSVQGRSRDIPEIDIANRISVLAKHRVDSLRELIIVWFVDTTHVYPKVLQAITSSLFFAELDLVIASLALACTIHQVFEGDLFGIGSLCVRKYSILGNIFAEVLGQTELAIVVAF